MALSINNFAGISYTTSVDSASSFISQNFTVINNDQEKRMLIFFITTSASDATHADLKAFYGGVEMTKVVTTTSWNSCRMSVFVLPSPPTGSNLLTTTPASFSSNGLVNSFPVRVAGLIMAMDNVNQSIPSYVTDSDTETDNYSITTGTLSGFWLLAGIWHDTVDNTLNDTPTSGEIVINTNRTFGAVRNTATGSSTTISGMFSSGAGGQYWNSVTLILRPYVFGKIQAKSRILNLGVSQSVQSKSRIKTLGNTASISSKSFIQSADAILLKSRARIYPQLSKYITMKSHDEEWPVGLRTRK